MAGSIDAIYDKPFELSEIRSAVRRLLEEDMVVQNQL
jgi:hypothetical protein